MVVRVIQIARLLIILASRHRSLIFEILALRQQLAVYHRTRPKPTIRWSDRLFWVGLRLAWPHWKSALVIVRPATLVGWHRRGFARSNVPVWPGRNRPAALPTSMPACMTGDAWNSGGIAPAARLRQRGAAAHAATT